jgi:hypothetical protein
MSAATSYHACPALEHASSCGMGDEGYCACACPPSCSHVGIGRGAGFDTSSFLTALLPPVPFPPNVGPGLVLTLTPPMYTCAHLNAGPIRCRPFFRLRTGKNRHEVRVNVRSRKRKARCRNAVHG